MARHSYNSRDKQRNSGKWVHLLTPEKAREVAKGHTRQIVSWTGVGVYWVFEYCVPCQRGCCIDDAIEIQPAEERIKEIREQIDELAGCLRDARAQQREYNTRHLAPLLGNPRAL